MKDSLTIFSIQKPVLQRRTRNGVSALVIVLGADDHSGEQEGHTDKRCSLCEWGMRHSTNKHDHEVAAYKALVGGE